MIEERRPTLAEYGELWLSGLMRIMPVTWLAAIGGFFGAREGRRAIATSEPWVQQVNTSLQRYATVTDPGERERRIVACTRRIGRTYAEFTALQRIANSDHLEAVARRLPAEAAGG